MVDTGPMMVFSSVWTCRLSVRAGLFLLCIGALWSLRPTNAAAHPPPFYWMPDLSADRQVGLDVAVGNSERIVDALPVVAASVFADITVADHVALIGRIPIAYASYHPIGQPDEDSSGFALGNVGVGLKLVDSGGQRQQRYRYGMEAYVHLPTASDDGDAALAALAASTISVPDRGRYAVDTTGLNLRGSGRYEGQSVFLQGDIGIDYYLIDGRDNVADILTAVGLGLEFSPYVAALAELTVVTEAFGYGDERDGVEFVPSLDVGIRYHDPDWIFGLRVHWPFAEDYRDSNVIAVGLDLSRRF